MTEIVAAAGATPDIAPIFPFFLLPYPACASTHLIEPASRFAVSRLRERLRTLPIRIEPSIPAFYSTLPAPLLKLQLASCLP
jgi:hypothetical protein